ncbi:MAG: B12-binding domain-containing radical SAM protein [Clostridiales bacterium]|nr:B12-binding domain-containing radical SAM protein [Clostridiales bacterium]
MRYEGTVYRPPSEAQSLIIQLTIGCARNTCTFCSMYKDKSFRIRPLEEVFEDIEGAVNWYPFPVRRVFLADGDALIVKTDDLLKVFQKVYDCFPNCERITMYGAPKDVLSKTDMELRQLHEAGLEMVYIGAESGDEEVLRRVKKGATAEEIQEAGQKLRKAGIKVSMTLISGLGSRKRLREHAIHSAELISAIKPEFVGFLTLMIEPGTPLYDEVRDDKFQRLKPEDVVEEMKLFLTHVDTEGTVFRANHASNYISLAGTLNRDKQLLLKQLEQAERMHAYKPENFRGL